MPQVSLYLSESEMSELKEQAGRASLSLSAYTRKLLRDNSAKNNDVQGWWSRVSGKLTDNTFVTPEDSTLDEHEIQAWVQALIMYMLDTCVCIEIMRGNLNVAKARISEDGFSNYAIPSIVAGELWTGVHKSKRVHENSSLLKNFLAPFEIVPFDTLCSEKYGEVRAYLETNGSKIGNNDTMIAAVALSHNATIITNNIKDFSRVPGLKVECWE